MSDLISRQAAIDSICRTVCDNPEICVSPCDEVKILRNMPSAQPEIVRCKDCTFYRSDGCFFSTAEIEEDGFCSWAERKTDG